MYKNFTKHIGMRLPYATKILHVMRLTTVIILIAVLQVSATTHAQKLTYSKKNGTYGQLFKEIKKQTGYNVILYRGQLDPDSFVDANFKDAPIDFVLTDALNNKSLTYTINKKTIIIQEKEKAIDIFSKLELSDKKTINQKQEISGKVVDDQGRPLKGASIKIKNTNRFVQSDETGTFKFINIPAKSILIISFVGYITKEIEASSNMEEIRLEPSSSQLDSVSIISNGYQKINKERATGAFTHVDSNTLNRSVGINIADRLEGVTSGLLLNRNLTNQANNPTISIRGRSTIFANTEPLVVLDGFPYYGTIDQINPNDVASIDILKDAAAASIWGTRAGNGVIVITTKNGKNNQKLSVDFTSTLTLADSPNLYYMNQISPSEYIDLEQLLFDKGFYNRTINLLYSPISIGVEIMNKKRNNLITPIEAENQLNALRSQDVRNDLNKYLYRSKRYQQYGLNLSGGSQNNRYYISAGYDKNLESVITDRYDRFTINAKNTISLFNDRLEFYGDLNFNVSNSYTRYSGYGNPFSPYERWVNEEGNSIPVVKNLRLNYVMTAGNGQLLDWLYKPKDELTSNSNNNRTQYRLSGGVNYKILKELSVNANYQYLRETNIQEQNPDINSYYVRNIINSYSSIVNNKVVYGVPFGTINNRNNGILSSKTLRIQLNYNKKITGDHEINGIVGYEGNDSRLDNYFETLYGYDDATKTNGNNLINPLLSIPLFYRNSSSRFPTAPNINETININQSFYSNASYIYKNRYVVSGSARRDESNLFGVNTNQKGIPLWSGGLAWIINNEKFYNISWLNDLKLRATYGYNGNVDKSTSGLLTVSNFGLTNPFGSTYSTIANPPNPTLRWEKVKTWNLGLDFRILNNKVYGSIDLYQKNATDLIGFSPIAFQSGSTQFKGNNADMKTSGVDVIINSVNLSKGFKWTSSLLINYNTDKVTAYNAVQSSNADIVVGNYNNPLVGYPYYGIFSFPSGGLDASGNPQGYVDGIISKDYLKISSLLDPSQLKYHGSASPKYFGSVINSFGYKSFELSINVIYKLDYFFRRLNVFDGNLANLSGSAYKQSSADYDKRWQKAGDELSTIVPAAVYPNNLARGNFFVNSEDLVEKGDHIRMQDIRFSYQFNPKTLGKSNIKNASLFIYARNLGILWKASEVDIDPDYGTFSIPQPFNLSLGIKITL